MRIIESKIEQIADMSYEVAFSERTSRKWIAGIVLLSIIVLGLFGFMSYLFIKSLSLTSFHKVLSFIGMLTSEIMIYLIAEYLLKRDYPQEKVLSFKIVGYRL